MEFPDHVDNKIRNFLWLGPFSVEEMLRLLEQLVGFVSVKEFVKLWAITGGTPRHVNGVILEKKSLEV